MVRVQGRAKSYGLLVDEKWGRRVVLERRFQWGCIDDGGSLASSGRASQGTPNPRHGDDAREVGEW